MLQPEPLAPHRAEPFADFAAVIRGEEAMAPASLRAPDNNLAVVRILDAARQSVLTGRRITLAPAAGELREPAGA